MSWRGQFPIPERIWNDPSSRTWAQQITGDPVIKTVTTTYTIETTDSTVLCDATTGAFTALLPIAANCKGFTVTVKKVDSSGNAVTLDAAETIDGAASVSLGSQWNSRTVQSDGTNYVILASV